MRNQYLSQFFLPKLSNCIPRGRKTSPKYSCELHLKMEVKIISRKIIKPSSPTPSHNRIFRLSLLDQLSSVSYVPLIFFYHKKYDDEISTTLKDSLSKTLTCFYPFAGRINDHMSIDCNDAGVPFIEARINCSMAEFLNQPNLELMYQFLPCLPIPKEPDNEIPQVAIQLNIFDCSSVAIAFCGSHKIMDLGTFMAFLKCWTSIARESFDDEQIYPSFQAASLFPPRRSLPKSMVLTDQNLLINEGKCIFKRLVFDATAISTLKAKATSQLVPHPSKVAVVSCFIWKHAMSAARLVHGPKPNSLLLHAVDMRRRMEPPLSEYAIGNIFWTAGAHYCCVAGKEIVLHNMVSILKESLHKINGNYIKNLQGEDGFLAIQKHHEEVKERHLKEKPDSYAFSSWCNSGLNKADFGWGKPIWVSFVRWFGTGSIYVVILNDNTNGDGIEAWVAMDEKVMDVLECDSEFLSFASLNPSLTVLQDSP